MRDVRPINRYHHSTRRTVGAWHCVCVLCLTFWRGNCEHVDSVHTYTLGCKLFPLRGGSSKCEVPSSNFFVLTAGRPSNVLRIKRPALLSNFYFQVHETFYAPPSAGDSSHVYKSALSKDLYAPAAPAPSAGPLHFVGDRLRRNDAVCVGRDL